MKIDKITINSTLVRGEKTVETAETISEAKEYVEENGGSPYGTLIINGLRFDKPLGDGGLVFSMEEDEFLETEFNELSN